MASPISFNFQQPGRRLTGSPPLPRIDRILKHLVFLLLLVWGGFSGGGQPAYAASFRLVDQDGVIHLTNAPTDPRYQRLREGSGTASGWLRLPGNSANRYGWEIRQAAERYGVEAKLVEAVIRVESGFDPWAVSRKGAQGLMQLMPQTAALLGVRNSFNPSQNIDGGVRYLRHFIDRYRGNLPLALAAYNAGPQVVDWFRGIPPYAETRQYVQRVLGLYQNGGRADTAQPIYRYEDAAGTVTYTNLVPALPRSR